MEVKVVLLFVVKEKLILFFLGILFGSICKYVIVMCLGGKIMYFVMCVLGCLKDYFIKGLFMVMC